MKETIRDWLIMLGIIGAICFGFGFLIGGFESMEYGKCKMNRVVKFLPSYVAGCYLLANFSWDMQIGDGYQAKPQRSHKRKKHK